MLDHSNMRNEQDVYNDVKKFKRREKGEEMLAKVLLVAVVV